MIIGLDKRSSNNTRVEKAFVVKKDNEIKINLTMQVQIICQAQLALGESRSHSNSMTKETMATLVETCK